MKKLLLIQFLFLSLACDSANENYYESMEAGFEDMLEVPTTEQSRLNKDETLSEGVSKKIIKTGEIIFQSDEIENDYKKIVALLPKFHGYVEGENQTKNDYRIDYSLTIRVASTSYDSLFSSLAGLASRLDSKSSNISDVTERYYDLKTRIANKKSLEQRYVDLLKKADVVKDILEIEKNLNEVRTDIERLQGQFNYLSQQVNLSTIHLSFYEILPYTYNASERKGFGARVLSSLDSGWQGFLSFLVAITSLWPFLILTVGGIYLFRAVRKRWKRGK